MCQPDLANRWRMMAISWYANTCASPVEDRPCFVAQRKRITLQRAKECVISLAGYFYMVCMGYVKERERDRKEKRR